MERSDEVREVEHRFMTAVKERDMAALEELLGEDFTLTTGRAGAEVRERSEWLRITDIEYRIESFDFEEFVVQSYGDVSVARSRYAQRGEMAGERRDTTFRMTDVWVKHPEGWKLHVRHAQPIAGD